jgi:predicted transcriptional regulator
VNKIDEILSQLPEYLEGRYKTSILLRRLIDKGIEHERSYIEILEASLIYLIDNYEEQEMKELNQLLNQTTRTATVCRTCGSHLI